MDLVGDFIGSELFIIDGDSLLLKCFSDKTLDFYPGFQLLHATYTVEKLLQKLKQRKCVFEIVFFDSNARFCIPAENTDDNNDRYLLAREAIIQHLLAVSKELKHGFDVQLFESYHSDAFEEHLLSSGAYVFMCHEGDMDEIDDIDDIDNISDDDDNTSDGEWQEDDSDNDDTADNEDENTKLRVSNSVIGLRLMIHWFIMHGCNIALINNLEFRDTKVWIYTKKLMR